MFVNCFVCSWLILVQVPLYLEFCIPFFFSGRLQFHLLQTRPRAKNPTHILVWRKKVHRLPATLLMIKLLKMKWHLMWLFLIHVMLFVGCRTGCVISFGKPVWCAGHLWEKNSRYHWVLTNRRTHLDFAPRFWWTCRSFRCALWWWIAVLLSQGLPLCTTCQQSKFPISRWSLQTVVLHHRAAHCSSAATHGWRLHSWNSLFWCCLPGLCP